MSVFTPGTGSDLTATNIPAAMLELATLANKAEQDFNGANPPAAFNNITVTFADDGTANIVASLPTTVQPDGAGGVSIVATDYLV